jgi:predicted MPP superfamily phosphohydrolase
MDAMQKAECESLGADVYSLQWLAAALEWTKPDLVVLSGDQLNGQDTVRSPICFFTRPS